MALPAALPTIRPISDLRTRLNDIEALAKETREPIIMTKNGSPSLVVLDSEAYNDLLHHERAVRKLREAEIEEHYVKQSVSYADVQSRVQEILDALKGHAHA